MAKLDHAINASLLLAYVALKTGDRVGLFAFDDGVRLFAEPQGGMTAFARLQRRAATIRYSQAETNFTLSMVELGRRLRGAPWSWSSPISWTRSRPSS
jgi:uncharacterized protein (DUF58 family)